MIRIRRAAPLVMLGGVVFAASIVGFAALAQATSRPVEPWMTEPEIKAFVYERIAGAGLVLVAAIWGLFAWFLSGFRGALADAVGKFERGVEKLADALVSHDTNPHAHLDLRDTVRDKTDRILDTLDELLRRDPSDSPRRRRGTDGEGEDHAAERGR